MISQKVKIGLLIVIGMGLLSLGLVKPSKREVYFKSCHKTSKAIFKGLNPNAKIDLINNKSTQACEALQDYADKNDAWDKVFNAELQGCTNAIAYLAKETAPKSLVQTLQLKYCDFK